MPFGKHKGLTMWQVVKSHPEYLLWLDGNGFDGEGRYGLAILMAIKHVKEMEDVENA